MRASPNTTRGAMACALAFAAGALLLGAACGQHQATVAVVLPESGPAGVYGRALRQGVELAASEMSARGRPPVSLAFHDSRSDPSRARELLATALRDGAAAAVGGVTSAEALAMAPVADRAQRVLISPTASSPQLTGLSPFLFRMFPSDDLEAARMARFASQTLGLEAVTVIADSRIYGEGVRRAFHEAFRHYLGAVEEIAISPHSDASALAAMIAEQAPRAVFLAAYQQTVVSLVRALRHAGYAGRILTTHAFATASGLRQAGSDAIGVLVPQTPFDVAQETPRVRAFVAAFKLRYAETPSLFAAYGYDSLRLLLEAGVALGGDDLRRRLRRLRLAGITGMLAFDRQGDIERSPRIYIVGEDLALHDYEGQLAAQRAALIARLEVLRQTAADRD